MSLHQRVKASIPDEKHVLSDPEILAINRRDYLVGEASPLGAFYSMFKLEGAAPPSYQDLELAQALAVLVAATAAKRPVVLWNHSRSTAMAALYLALRVAGQGRAKRNRAKIHLGVDMALFSNLAGDFGRVLLDDLEGFVVTEGKANEASKRTNALPVFLVDARDAMPAERAMLAFRPLKTGILAIRNLTHHDAVLNVNPFALADAEVITAVSGWGTMVKVERPTATGAKR